MPRETFATTVEKWRRLLGQLEVSGVRIPEMDGLKTDLAAMYERAHQLVTERAAHQAAMQTATRELQEILEKGRIKLTVLRLGLKQELGETSEQLAAFDIRPHRKGSRRRKKTLSQE